MKRPPQSFVVQHKRRPRLTKGEPASIWSGDVGRELRGLMHVIAEPSVDQVDTADTRLTAIASGTPNPAPPRRILEARIEPNAASTSIVEAEKAKATLSSCSVIPSEFSHVSGGLDNGKTPQSAEVARLQPEEIASSLEETLPSGPASPSNGKGRLGYHQRRKAARKGLPMGERWRWNFKY